MTAIKAAPARFEDSGWAVSSEEVMHEIECLCEIEERVVVIRNLNNSKLLSLYTNAIQVD